MKTLIVGCSFLSTLADNTGSWKLDQDRYLIAATAGSGNQSMTSRMIFECAQQPFEEVIVIWSGINRIDVSIPSILHETQPKRSEHDYEYSFTNSVGNQTWYHSGGLAGSWTQEKSCPEFIKNWFKIQHLCGDTPYLRDQSLISIINAQSFLESRNIKYRMAFAYDVFGNTDPTHEHFFGKLDESYSTYQNLINWDRIDTDHTLFEWAHTEPSRIEDDKFHVTKDAVRQWFDLVFNIDLVEMPLDNL
jgi:hypothetical protein